MGHTLELGDILVSSWGYGQININFYKVVGVTKAMVRFIKLKKKDAHRSIPYQYVVAIDDVAALGPQKPQRKKVHVNDRNESYIRLTSFSAAYKWNGQPVGETMGQYGH